MSIKSPAFLKPGDVVAIIAPARKVKQEDILPAEEILKSWGLEVRLGKNLFGDFNQFSGTDEQRLSDLQEMLDDKEIKALFSARGGYGITRLLDKVKYKKIKKNPKWVCGFSDVTALLSRLYNEKIQSVHCTMPALFAKEGAAESVESIRKILFGENIELSASPDPLNRKGEVKGTIVGGNLSMLVNQIGTSSDVSTKNKILFIEDLDEYLYHIDRMMVHLKRAGKLDRLKGLIVGQMSDMKDNNIPFGKCAYNIIAEHVAEYNYPVCFNFPIGHSNPNLALIVGRKAKLEVGEDKVILSYA